MGFHEWAFAESERLRSIKGDGEAAECPQCGTVVYPEDCEALLSCERCGWLGPKGGSYDDFSQHEPAFGADCCCDVCWKIVKGE